VLKISSAFQLISIGWRSFKTNAWSFLGALLIFCIGFLSLGIVEDNEWLTWVLFILLIGVTGAGLTYMFLAAADGHRVRMFDMFSVWRLTLSYLCVLLITFGPLLIARLLLALLQILVIYSPSLPLHLLLVVGFLLYVLLALRLSLAGYFLIDRACSPVEALRLSWNTTRGKVIRIFAFNMASLLVIAIGILFLGVGAIPAVIVTRIGFAKFYREVTGEVVSAEPSAIGHVQVS
jgi:hypothetical protein